MSAPCPRGGEIVDYVVGLCSCGECPMPSSITINAQFQGNRVRGNHAHTCPTCSEHVPCNDVCSTGLREPVDGLELGGFVECDGCKLRASSARQFPIHPSDRDLLASVPWDMVAPHDPWARLNHGKSLEQLAAYSGLGLIELAFVLLDRQYQSCSPSKAARNKARADALRYIKERVKAHEEAKR